MKKIISVIGTRPNFIKIAPLCREFDKYKDKILHLLCHTGQHFDEKMSKVFFEDLGMPDPDFHLGIKGGTHAEQTARIMIAFEEVLSHEKPDMIIVVGDVNSTMACTLAAVKLHIPVAHVESGLRSGDRKMPEEINRIVTDAIADILFVTEKSGLENLKREGIPDQKVFFAGNIMIDSLVYFESKIKQRDPLQSLGLKQGDYFLVTFHRPSNVDHKQPLADLIGLLNEISFFKKVVFPIHPRTRRNIIEFGLSYMVSKNVFLADPFGYIEFQALIRDSFMIITDSGGIQEETTFLGVPCVTLRDNTERPVTVETGTNYLCGSNLHAVKELVLKIQDGQMKKGKIPELWDGHTAERIVQSILIFLGA